MHIGTNIRTLRTKHNWTQEQLAEKLGISYQAVSKWENHQNTPDITLLPTLASLFGISIDALFAEDPAVDPNLASYLKDDGVIRIIQLRGKEVIRVTEKPDRDAPPIEIAFPHDCNNRTQYFRVEVFGHLCTDSSINGDVVCHQTLQCGSINGDVHAGGDIKVSELNSQRVVCNQINDCYKLTAAHLECAGTVNTSKME